MTKPLSTSLRTTTTRPSLETLNREFAPLSFEERLRRLYTYFPEQEVLLTSSFGTKSALLLYWMQHVRPTQPVYFLNTTYHFPETLQYKERLTEAYALRVIDILPDAERNRLTREAQMWASQPERCCHYNKVVPLRAIKEKHQLWISGVMGYQTGSRAGMQIFEEKEGIIKFHPFIDMEEAEFLYYSGLYRLPAHPLEALGYGSIGCTHCTAKGSGRAGRWPGRHKDECGLHVSS